MRPDSIKCEAEAVIVFKGVEPCSAAQDAIALLVDLSFVFLFHGFDVCTGHYFANFFIDFFDEVGVLGNPFHEGIFVPIVEDSFIGERIEPYQ